MTIRSKQWYTKASRLANSFAKISIGRLRLFLHRQQDHRPDDRWKSKHPTAGTGEGRKGSRERNRRFRSLAQLTNPHRQEKSSIGRKSLGFQNFKICLGRFRIRVSGFELRHWPQGFTPKTEYKIGIT